MPNDVRQAARPPVRPIAAERTPGGRRRHVRPRARLALARGFQRRARAVRKLARGGRHRPARASRRGPGAHRRVLVADSRDQGEPAHAVALRREGCRSSRAEPRQRVSRRHAANARRRTGAAVVRQAAVRQPDGELHARRPAPRRAAESRDPAGPRGALGSRARHDRGHHRTRRRAPHGRRRASSTRAGCSSIRRCRCGSRISAR